MGKSKTDLEWVIYRTSQIPAPGVYEVEERIPAGGKFNMVCFSEAESTSGAQLLACVRHHLYVHAFRTRFLCIFRCLLTGRITALNAQANPKTPLDFITMEARKMPGPGQYYKATDGNHGVTGGKFNAGRSKSDIDWTIYRAKRLPGPGQYEIDKPSKFLAKNVPAFSFQGRPGPATLPRPFQNMSPTLRVGTATDRSRSRTAMGLASRSLDATTMSALSAVQDGHGEVASLAEASAGSLRATTARFTCSLIVRLRERGCCENMAHMVTMGSCSIHCFGPPRRFM